MLDVNQLIDQIGLGNYHVLQLLLVSGVLISDGAEVLVSSVVLSGLQKPWHLGPVLKGAMMSIIFLGVFAGNLVGGSLADAVGRRRAVLCAYAGIVVFGLLTACAQGPATMLTARFVFGVFYGMGVGPCVALQVETTPASCRGHMVNLSSIFFTFGEVYAAVLMITLMPQTEQEGAVPNNWRWVTALAVAPGLFLFPFSALLLQESPHFLLVRGKQAEALVTIKHIARMNNSEEVLALLDEHAASQAVIVAVPHESARTGLLASQRATAEGPSRSITAEQDSKPFMDRLGIILRPEYRTIVIGGAYICFLSNFLFYGLTYALPQIFQTLNKELSPAVQTLVVSLCDVPGLVLAYLLIRSKEIGHRDGLSAMAGVACVLAVMLCSIDQGEAWLWLALPSAYLLKYIASAFFTLAYVYLGEVFPSTCRCTALSICMAGGRIGSMLAPVLFELLTIKGVPGARHSAFLGLNAALSFCAIPIIRSLLAFELKNEPLEDLVGAAGASPGTTKGAQNSYKSAIGLRTSVPSAEASLEASLEVPLPTNGDGEGDARGSGP